MTTGVRPHYATAARRSQQNPGLVGGHTRSLRFSRRGSNERNRKLWPIEDRVAIRIDEAQADSIARINSLIEMGQDHFGIAHAIKFFP